jgi:hypothetical protein
LLLVQENKACRQWEFQGLLSHISLWEYSSEALLFAQENKACVQREFWSLIFHKGFREPSVTHGASGIMGPAYTGVPVSLVFQDEGSRSCIRGECGSSEFLCVPGKGTYHPVTDPEATGNLRGKGSGVLSYESFFPFLQVLVVSLFVYSERALILVVYGTPRVPFLVI